MSEELSTELATPNAIADLVASSESKYASEQALATVTKVGNYLPYLQLLGSNSMEVKRGNFPMGHFGLRRSKNVVEDLGSEVAIFVINWRPKAMQYAPDVLSFFDVSSDAFKEIQSTADNKNSSKGYGPEFLLWLPEVKAFATYFLGNKTGRNESPNILGPFKSDGPFVCLQKSELIETKDFSWHGPLTKPYNLSIEMPPLDKLSEELRKFNNPPATVRSPVETDTEDSTDSRD